MREYIDKYIDLLILTYIIIICIIVIIISFIPQYYHLLSLYPEHLSSFEKSPDLFLLSWLCILFIIMKFFNKSFDLFK
jgi:hypothetical protein